MEGGLPESAIGDSVSGYRDYSDIRSSCGDSCSSVQLGWPVGKSTACLNPEEKKTVADDEFKLKKKGYKASELEMMKERFAKLLLGEDMSGSGKGASTALTISNAITNLCASVFGQLWRLEPLPSEKKAMWQREMEWLVSVSDHIVEMIPSWQTFSNGNKLEVMTCQPRSDLIINLPALRKLDKMLPEILDGFTDTGFWYVDQGIVTPEADGSISSQRATKRQTDKWWLPVPRVPPGGLPEVERKKLHNKRECANQILKAATAINAITLADMEVPDSYFETLPKNGRMCLGDIIYRYITSDHFSAECLLDCLKLSSEHAALEIANRVEAAIYLWRGQDHPHPPSHPIHSLKSSWEVVRGVVLHVDKRALLAQRAEALLLCLKHRFPGLPQTTLDTTKIQYNKDIGKSILESYSRVLESLAFNIVARIEDLLYVDDITKQSDKVSSMSLGSTKKVPVPYTAPASGTPYRSTYTTPTFSPGPRMISPARGGDRTPSMSGNNKSGGRGMGVKRVLTNYLSGDDKVKNCGLVDGTSSGSDAQDDRDDGRGRRSNLASVMRLAEKK